MAQWVPNSIGLRVEDAGEAYDRAVLFPQNAAAIVVNSIDVWVAAGQSIRAAIIRSDSASTTTGAVVVQDLGLFTNSTGSDGWVNKVTTGSPSIAISKYPGIVIRQDAAPNFVSTVGEGFGYPHGDAIYASRSINDYAGITTAFPSPLFTDEGIDASARIPYVRLNYTAAASTQAIAGDLVSTSAMTGTLVNVGLKFVIKDMDTGVAKNSVTYSTVHVFLASSRGSIVKSYTSKATNASGEMTLTDPLLASVGTVYDIAGWSSDGSDRFHATATVAVL